MATVDVARGLEREASRHELESDFDLNRHCGRSDEFRGGGVRLGTEYGSAAYQQM
jgi:hypothetical protein